MASSKEYLEYVLDQLSDVDEISYRAMMGEYIIYYRGKIIGGIYDDRFLVKPVKAAIAMMPNANMEALEKAPPENMSSRPSSPSRELAVNCVRERAWTSIPGRAMNDPTRKIRMIPNV